MLLNLAVEFVNGDACQKSPEIARLGELVFTVLRMREEAAIRRLDNIVGIDAAAKLGADSFANQCQQPFDVAVEDDAGGMAVAMLDKG